MYLCDGEFVCDQDSANLNLTEL